MCKIKYNSTFLNYNKLIKTLFNLIKSNIIYDI